MIAFITLISRFVLPLLIASLLALLVVLYYMVGADREAERAPFLHQRQSALARAKAARLAIGALLVIVLELIAVWAARRFQPAVLATTAAGVTPTVTATSSSTATPRLEPTITLTPTPIPPTSTVTPTSTWTPTVTPSATPTPEYVIHEVQPGDTFSEIAAEFGVTITVLEAANPDVEPARLQIGQEIRIPATLITPTVTPQVSSGSIVADRRYPCPWRLHYIPCRARR